MPYDYQDLDLLLLEIAKKIQLNKTDYDKAVDRYERISDHVREDSSEIAGFNPHIYSQGSFRINSTISNSDERDEFDIDLLMEMDINPDNDPDIVLDAVFRSLDRGRYKNKVEKKKRCVTVDYSDMHLDVTPAVRLSLDDHVRPSQIFDCHPDRDDHVKAAPEGFANWFDGMIQSRMVTQAVATNKRADAEPVPEQKSLDDKPPRLIALQLIKRWRDMQHNKKDSNCEKIPSILLSKYLADAPDSRDQSIYNALINATDYLIAIMSASLGIVVNPTYPKDVLTDRWPGNNPNNQSEFLNDMRQLKAALTALPSGTDEQINNFAKTGFGERASTRALALMEGARFANSQGHPNDRSLVEAIKQRVSGWAKGLAISVGHEETPKWRRMTNINVGISATLHSSENGPLTGTLTSGDVIQKGRHICFSRTIPSRGTSGGHRTHWRITNTGQEAASAKSLRGDFCNTTGQTRWEHAGYTGIHWAQAFVVDNRGNLIGESEKFYVVVD